MKEYLLIIVGDENDADYITEITSVDETFDFERLEKISKTVQRSKQSHNWMQNSDELDPYDLYKNILTDEEIDWLEEFIPQSEDGIHTIKSITLYEVGSTKQIFPCKTN